MPVQCMTVTRRGLLFSWKAEPDPGDVVQLPSGRRYWILPNGEWRRLRIGARPRPHAPGRRQ
jgi:hypothetical protein